jgi:hypothetical protein
VGDVWLLFFCDIIWSWCDSVSFLLGVLHQPVRDGAAVYAVVGGSICAGEVSSKKEPEDGAGDIGGP